MTAIDKYTRLEALGQWREGPDQAPKEVVVSFGNATLLFSDVDENPLCHWAMAATSRLSLEGEKAVYTPDTEGFETLEINDAEMIEAIAQVSRAAVIVNGPRHWLRWVFLAVIVSALATIAYITPSLLRDQAVLMTGPESARKIGSDMVATLDIETCREPRADAVRALLESRLFLDGDTTLIFTKNQLETSIFPGGVVLIGNDTLQNMRAPDELATLTATLSTNGEKTIVQMFETSSLRELFGYITTGKLSEEHLAKTAKNIIDRPKIVQTSEVSSTGQQLLRDQDWVTLQGICLE